MIALTRPGDLDGRERQGEMTKGGRSPDIFVVLSSVALARQCSSP
jgi:hypothetical protein